jgi:hypothetical protein
MRKATRITATVLGLVAGGAGIEHGVFEALQGNAQPAGLMIASIGPPCVPEQTWNACEPAMTVMPSFLLTGILAIALGCAVMIWSAFFLQRRRGGLVLILLSVLLLLFGGGIFPPIIGFVAGALGTRIHKPLAPEKSRLSGGSLRFLAALYPWALVLLLAWLLGQWVIGHFANDWLLANGYLIIVMVLGSLLFSVISCYAYDLRQAPGEPSGSGADPSH